MIKIVFCLRRLPGLSVDQFQHHWLHQHAPLVRQAADALRIRRYTQSHALTDARLAAPVTARGSTEEPFDGVAQLWWDTIDDAVAAGATPEGRAWGRRLLEDERRFIDLPRSPLFFATEHEIL